MTVQFSPVSSAGQNAAAAMSSLREGELRDAAIARTGLSDFGDTAYLTGLRVLLDAFETDLRLTPCGRQVARQRVLRALIARLYAQQGWTGHPEVLTQSISRPLIITGLPRTGTTALHRLLSVDPQFQGPETWLLRAPMIRPPRNTWAAHPAYRACAADLEAFHARVPQIPRAHESIAAEVEECSEILTQSFASDVWSVAYRLPTYRTWLANQSARDSYRRYVNVLRLIGAYEPQRRWLLKSPYHMFEMDALLEVLPDACIIQTHRDPVIAIPSLCSLAHMFVSDLAGDAVRPDAIGPWQCDYWRQAMDRMQAARRKLTRLRLFDVDHRRFTSDAMGTVRAIYEYLGLSLSAETERHMRAWIVAKPTARHGEHKYASDCWGVTPQQIAEVFADYRAQHEFI
jgi:hypothetical protein